MTTRKSIRGFALAGVAALLAACGTATGPDGQLAARARAGGDDASSTSGAATNDFARLRLRCELRTRGRSRISVDGNNLVSGLYTAVVTSGANSATAGPRATVGDEVEFDFDSDPRDIAAGATAISADFIQAGSTPHVTAMILDPQGQTIVTAGGDCDIRR